MLNSLQVPDMVRSVDSASVLRMRQQIQLLYNQYFSSVHNIVHTTLQVRYNACTNWDSVPI